LLIVCFAAIFPLHAEIPAIQQHPRLEYDLPLSEQKQSRSYGNRVWRMRDAE
jgi:hypothetical protein